MRFLKAVVILIVTVTMVQAKTLKISTEYPDGTSVLNELRHAGDVIEKRTEGRVTFKFYPGGVMGSSTAVLRKIRIGQLHGAFIQSGALANDYRDAQVLNAPLLFRNFDEVDVVRKALDEQIIHGYINAGWQTFGLVEGGFAYAMTNVPVESLEALRQQKIWLPANDPFSTKIADNFDINPIVMNISDVLTALQTGAINAVVVPPAGAIALQWHTRTEYLTDAPFMYTYGLIAINRKYFDGISQSDQQILLEELGRASHNLDIQARQDNLTAFDALQKLGIQIRTLSPDARQEIEKEAKASTLKLINAGEFGSEIYQQVIDLLLKYRNE